MSSEHTAVDGGVLCPVCGDLNQTRLGARRCCEMCEAPPHRQTRLLGWGEC